MNPLSDGESIGVPYVIQVLFKFEQCIELMKQSYRIEAMFGSNSLTEAPLLVPEFQGEARSCLF